MLSKENKKIKKKGSGFDRFISGIERIGNKLPHPFWLFVLLSVIVILASFVLSKAGVAIPYMKGAKGGGAPEMAVATVNNLLSGETLVGIFTGLTDIYTGFAPLGLVMIMMLGVGMLEQTGMLNALIRKTILGAPPALLMFIIALVGVNANLASDAGIVIVPAVAGAVFHSMGLNPWVGVITGYVAANGGFSANLFIGGTDALLAGITESVTTAAGIEAPVHPMINYFFMIVATFVIAGATVLVTKFFTEPHLSDMKIKERDANAAKDSELTPEENRGLKFCVIATVLFVAATLALCLPASSPFRNDAGGFLPKSPLLSSIIAILFLFFFILAIAYGKGAGVIKSMSDVPAYMQKGVSSALGFIVIALPASVFIQLFSESNLSTVIGAAGGKLLQSMNLNGFPLLLAFIVLTTAINLFVTSGSAKWLILAPIFVPMFANMGFSPAMTQITYRCADTCSNIISPLDYYVPVIMGLLSTYNDDPDRKVGIGTVLSLCMPYTIAYLIGLCIQLFVWLILDLPLGPGVAIHL